MTFIGSTVCMHHQCLSGTGAWRNVEGHYIVVFSFRSVQFQILKLENKSLDRIRTLNSHWHCLWKLREASEATHKLVDAMATSRARVAETQTSRRGDRLTEEGVRALAVGHIRQTLSVAAVQAQCCSLLGRLESLGPGA